MFKILMCPCKKHLIKGPNFGAQINVSTKIYPNYVRIDQFLRDLQLKEIFSSTGRQTLNCRMETKLTMVPK